MGSEEGARDVLLSPICVLSEAARSEEDGVDQ